MTKSVMTEACSVGLRFSRRKRETLSRFECCRRICHDCVEHDVRRWADVPYSRIDIVRPLKGLECSKNSAHGLIVRYCDRDGPTRLVVERICHLHRNCVDATVSLSLTVGLKV